MGTRVILIRFITEAHHVYLLVSRGTRWVIENCFSAKHATE